MIATLGVLSVVAPSLKWVSNVNMYTAFGGSHGVVVFAPRLVGAVIAVPTAILAARFTGVRRLGFWTIGAFALLGQMVMSLEWLSSGHRLASRTDLGSLQVGWFVDLSVVILGAVTIAVGATVVIRSVWTSRAEVSRPRSGAVSAAVALGAVVVWLLSRDPLFVARWPFEAVSPPLSVAVLVASWTVIVIGVLGPVLPVAAASNRVVAVGVICGWWAFLAMPWADAVVTRWDAGLLPPTPRAFWIGTALAVGGGLALIVWSALSDARVRKPATQMTAVRFESTPGRTDNDPLRR